MFRKACQPVHRWCRAPLGGYVSRCSWSSSTECCWSAPDTVFPCRLSSDLRLTRHAGAQFPPVTSPHRIDTWSNRNYTVYAYRSVFGNVWTMIFTDEETARETGIGWRGSNLILRSRCVWRVSNSTADQRRLVVWRGRRRRRQTSGGWVELVLDQLRPVAITVTVVSVEHGHCYWRRTAANKTGRRACWLFTEIHRLQLCRHHNLMRSQRSSQWLHLSENKAKSHLCTYGIAK